MHARSAQFRVLRTTRPRSGLAIEYELLRHATLAQIGVTETQINPTSADDKHVRIEGLLALKEDEDGEPVNDAEHYAFGFGVLSFTDARRGGVSGMHFEDKDDWSVGDMLRHLRFEHASFATTPTTYVRGRCMKTTVAVRANGTFMLDTVNRGEAATRWIAKLQEKKVLRAIIAAEPSLGDSGR